MGLLLFCPWASVVVRSPASLFLSVALLGFQWKAQRIQYVLTWLDLNSKTCLPSTKHWMKSLLSTFNSTGVFHWIPRGLIVGTCSLVVSQQFEEDLSTDLGAPRPAFLFSGTSLFNFQQLQQHHTVTSEFSIQSVSLFLTGLCFLSTLQNEECPQGKSCPMWISTYFVSLIARIMSPPVSASF